MLTDPQIRAIAVCGVGAYQDLDTAEWSFSDKELMHFARTVIAQGDSLISWKELQRLNNEVEQLNTRALNFTLELERAINNEPQICDGFDVISKLRDHLDELRNHVADNKDFGERFDHEEI
jgi:hypothetical protein